MKMNDNNGLILLEVKCKSKGNNIITIDNIYCIISVSYHIEKNDLFLFFQSTCKEGETDIFDLECHYKKIIDEDYDDEKIFVMNIVGEASLKIEEMVGFFASQIIIAS